MPIVSFLFEKLRLGLNFRRGCLVGLLLLGLFWLMGKTPLARARMLSRTELSRTELSTSPILSDQRVALDPGADANCLMCHANPDFKASFQNGDLFSLYVDGGEYGRSVHGSAGLTCVTCHSDSSRYPHHDVEEQVTCIQCHPEEGGQADTTFVTLRVQLPFADHREMTLNVNQACRQCHESEFRIVGDSAHVKVRHRDAPVCVDCHGSHDITRAGEPRASISQRCGTCHKAVYTTYRTSVHGAALDSESNPDVPTCTSCHGAHYIPSPKTAVFRAESPELCACCHANEQLMAKYGLSTHVFETYLDDFHGKTLQLFGPKPDSLPREAVCFDCHGYHNVRRTDDPEAGIGIKENLSEICRQCHSDATVNFPDAWLGHYEPSPDKAAPVYYTEIFFTILTASAILALIGHMVLDFSRLVVKKIRA